MTPVPVGLPRRRDLIWNGGFSPLKSMPGEECSHILRLAVNIDRSTFLGPSETEAASGWKAYWPYWPYWNIREGITRMGTGCWLKPSQPLGLDLTGLDRTGTSDLCEGSGYSDWRPGSGECALVWKKRGVWGGGLGPLSKKRGEGGSPQESRGGAPPPKTLAKPNGGAPLALLLLRALPNP